MSDDPLRCEARCLRCTEGAMLLEMRVGGEVRVEWIPRSCILDDSEVFGVDHLSGVVSIDGRFADHRGIRAPDHVATASPDSYPSVEVVRNVLAYVSAVGASLENLRTSDAACECGCDRGDGHPAAEHEYVALEDVRRVILEMNASGKLSTTTRRALRRIIASLEGHLDRLEASRSLRPYSLCECEACEAETHPMLGHELRVVRGVTRRVRRVLEENEGR